MAADDEENAAIRAYLSRDVGLLVWAERSLAAWNRLYVCLFELGWRPVPGDAPNVAEAAGASDLRRVVS